VNRLLLDTGRWPGHASRDLQAGRILAAGLFLLLVRPLATGGPHVSLVLAGMYLLIGVMSVAASVPPRQSALANPVLVLAIGAGAFLLGAFVSGPTIPFPVARNALTMNALAAVTEEAFFRRFLYGRLIRHGPTVAIIGSALVFALVHVPAYGLAAFWVDLGAGLVLSWQRWSSGRWTVPAATHVFANLVTVMR
jgi:membrane protease YdiL (CAAX protease family)